MQIAVEHSCKCLSRMSLRRAHLAAFGTVLANNYAENLCAFMLVVSVREVGP
jgi:hypothetical protein